MTSDGSVFVEMNAPQLDAVDGDEMLRIQISELEMLQSMFPNPGELCLDDYLLAHFHNYLNGKTSLFPNHLDFTICLVIDTKKLEMCINLPSEYPNSEPDIFVRGEGLNRNQQRLLNTDMRNYISSLDRGDMCIGLAVGWLQENAPLYFKDETEDKSLNENKPVQHDDNRFTRLWIYSHHIYSKVKRREILNLAQEYKLTGFSMPGRPGIICVEGLSSDCEEWWFKIKSMTWKKIMCKNKEEFEIDKTTGDELRKFSEFVEISFEVKGKGRDYHMNFGEFHKYLIDHSCDYIFKELFGVEGKS